jgi:hypothetical protein
MIAAKTSPVLIADDAGDDVVETSGSQFGAVTTI